MQPSPAWIIELLGLKPQGTCGFMGETYVSDLQIPAASLPAAYQGGRPAGGVFYFLVTPLAGVRLHRIRSDQMYHHYLGDPLEVLLLRPGTGSEVRVVGPDLAAGMRPQLLIPGGTFHAARIRAGEGYALLGTSVWARAEPRDVELGDPEQLKAQYPEARSAIAEFTAALGAAPASARPAAEPDRGGRCP
jgi:predicted cupin superfamily sugar epimerase